MYENTVSESVQRVQGCSDADSQNACLMLRMPHVSVPQNVCTLQHEPRISPGRATRSVRQLMRLLAAVHA